MKPHDFCTYHLRPHEALIADLMLSVLPPDATGGGCWAFWSPDKWKQRGEKHGTNSLLVVVHDGGDLAPYCSLDYGAYQSIERMAAVLGRAGLFIEQCTDWYSAVYLAGVYDYGAGS